MERLKQRLAEECAYKLSDRLLDKLLGMTTEVRVKPGRALIKYGQLDENVYIVKEGIVRYLWFDGLRERTYGFAEPGSMIVSYHCYYLRQPSFFQIEACRREVVALRLSNADLKAMIDSSHDVSKWMLHLSLGQLLVNEFKLSIINGDTRERFESLIKSRPDILAGVSMRAIASYLGVTPAYLSRLKNSLPDQQRENLDTMMLYRRRIRARDGEKDV